LRDEAVGISDVVEGYFTKWQISEILKKCYITKFQ